MKISVNWLRISGIIFFFICVLLGTAIFVSINWAALEAYFYFGYGAPADKPLTSLRCPPVMTAAETGAFTISYTNPLDFAATPNIQTDISYLDLTTTQRFQPSFAPGETRTLRWEMTPANVVYGHLILVQVNVSSFSALPSRQGTCGTLFVNLSKLTGAQVLGIALAAWLLSTLLGWGLWLTGSRRAQGKTRSETTIMMFLTADLLAGFLAGYQGWWGMGVACLVLVVLLIVAAVGYFI
jgi:hypothetical protein